MFSSDLNSNGPLYNGDVLNRVSFKELLTRLIVESILSDNSTIRQTAALLAFNYSWGATQIRKTKCIEYDEHWVSEMIAALCSGLQAEIQRTELEDDETGI
jgi:hypothetical protein